MRCPTSPAASSPLSHPPRRHSKLSLATNSHHQQQAPSNDATVSRVIHGAPHFFCITRRLRYFETTCGPRMRNQLLGCCQTQRLLSQPSCPHVSREQGEQENDKDQPVRSLFTPNVRGIPRSHSDSSNAPMLSLPTFSSTSSLPPFPSPSQPEAVRDQQALQACFLHLHRMSLNKRDGGRVRRYPAQDHADRLAPPLHPPSIPRRRLVTSGRGLGALPVITEDLNGPRRLRPRFLL